MKNFNLKKIRIYRIILILIISAIVIISILILRKDEKSERTDEKTAVLQGNKQSITIAMDGEYYPDFTVKAGVPLKWILKAKESDLNECNSEIVIKEYGIKKELSAGENIIEFTPRNEEKIIYSCSMKMIFGEIKVIR